LTVAENVGQSHRFNLQVAAAFRSRLLQSSYQQTKMAAARCQLIKSCNFFFPTRHFQGCHETETNTIHSVINFFIKLQNLRLLIAAVCPQSKQNKGQKNAQRGQPSADTLTSALSIKKTNKISTYLFPWDFFPLDLFFENSSGIGSVDA